MDQLKALLKPNKDRDALRQIGGLLVGVGMLVWFTRKETGTQISEPYGDFALFLMLLVPAIVLYGMGILGRQAASAANPKPWHSIFTVFGVAFVPLALFQFLELIDGNTNEELNVMWIFLVTAALAAYAALAAGVRVQMLIAAIAFGIAWLSFWDQVLDFSDGVEAFRIVLMVLAGIYALFALFGEKLKINLGPAGGELLTGAAIAAVLGAGASIIAIAQSSAPVSVVPKGAEATIAWDAILLVVSLLAIWIGARNGVRGPVYVGAIGLLLFIFITGADLAHSDDPNGKFVGWPLILVGLGVAGIAASLKKGVKLPSHLSAKL